MDNSHHIHRLSPKASVFDFLLSFFLLFLSCSVLVIKVPQLAFGQSDFMDYLTIAFIVFLLLPFGILFLIMPFATKLVVKGTGLEYHGPAFVLAVEWKDLVNVGYIKSPLAGKTLVVVSQGGKLKLKSWTMPIRNIVAIKPRDIRILVSQFGSANGHSFEADILVNVTQLVSLSDELESL
jgi:hypothetical protein